MVQKYLFIAISQYREQKCLVCNGPKIDKKTRLKFNLKGHENRMRHLKAGISKSNHTAGSTLSFKTRKTYRGPQSRIT